MNINKENIAKYSKELRSNGIVVISDYWPPNKCKEIGSKVEKLLDNGGLAVADDNMSYRDLVDFEKPIISERKGSRDDGMLDIFNMEKAISELSEFKNNEGLLEIINRAEKKDYSAENINVYLNKSVINTRGYHADTYLGKYKSFLYLTDVPDKSYGPFSYIKRSHNPSGLQKKMRRFVNKRILNKPPTNALIPLKFRELICVAAQGTLIIANQAGLHRGNSQEKGKKRVLITTSYIPI